MIEYLAPSSTSGISNLKYIEVNLSGADFTKLNTNPLVLIDTVPGKTIFPIAVSIQYDNAIAATANGFYAIGALSVFQGYGSASAHLMAIISGNIASSNGTIFLSNYQNTPPPGFSTLAATDTPIVLYDDSNNFNQFPTFIFKCLYLEI